MNLWPTLTGGEAIDLLGRLRGGLDPGRRADLLERFELDPTKKGRAYSKGNRQKVALVAALASDAELLVLDEPTSGLDPLKEAVFQACIEETRGAGRTVLLSSHILAEVEALCDRVTIIRAGRTVETGTLSELRHLTRTSINVETVQPPSGLAELPGVHNLHVEDHRARFDVDTVHLDETIRRLADVRRAQPDEHAAHPRGAVPPPLRRRDRMSRLTGVPAMLRLALRRERIRIPVYLLLFGILVADTAAQSESMFPTAAARADYAATVTGNPGLIAMVGPPYAVTNVGGDVAWQLGGFGAAFVALMSMFIVGRHTRGEEQSGRSELVGAAPVAREAPVTAALVVVVAAQVVLGVAVALAMIGLGQPERRLARARRLAHRRGAGVRRGRGVCRADQRDDLGDVRDGRRGDRRLLPPARRGRRRRRDAVVALADRLGAVDAARTPESAGGRWRSRSSRRRRSSPVRSRCARAATRAPGSWPPGPGRRARGGG